MPSKHFVSFTAREKVKEPVIVDFKTKNGQEVTFAAHKKVLEEVPVSFWAKGR